MKSNKSETTTPAQLLQKKNVEQQSHFFQTEQAGSALGNSQPAFFSAVSNSSIQCKPFFIQPKLSIGQPGDQYEQEADHMADQVVQRLAVNKSGAAMLPPVDPSITGSTSGHPLMGYDLTHVGQPNRHIQKQDSGASLADAGPSPDQQNSRTFPFASNSATFSRLNATYTPVGPSPQVGRLDITLRVHFSFVGVFQQTERDQYARDFESSVENAWSRRHALVLNDPNMDQHRCEVNINVETVDDPANAHFQATVARRRRGFRSNVLGNQVELDDNDAANNEELSVTRADYFKRVGEFDYDSAALNPDVEADLREIESFLAGVPASVRNAPDIDQMIGIDYTGLASTEGSRAYNKQLANRRINTVQSHIQAAFPDLSALEMPNPQGETNTEADPKYRRVDVKIDLPATIEPENTRQNTAAHEAGHMFGLGDEYIEEDRGVHRFEGDESSHTNMVRTQMGDAAAAETIVGNNESIMSHGMNVLRGHYVLFLGVLKRVSGNQNWNVE